MPFRSGPVSSGVKRPFALVLSLTLASPLLSAAVDPKLEQTVRGALPVCADAKIEFQDLRIPLPPRFTGVIAQVESTRMTCAGQYAAIVSPTGGLYLGRPWPIEAAEGDSLEEKLRSFAWRNLQLNVSARIDGTRTADGLWRVTLDSITEAGTVPLEGEIDPQGRAFFFGTFRRLDGDISAQRAASLSPHAALAPSLGPESARVTIVEFSDFECPSCRRSSGLGERIAAEHEGQVRYVRFDLPLPGHPWSFAASVAGRAIWRQSPEAFWKYKKQVYDNQESLNAFTFWDWARGFAQDHGLDMGRFDADVASDNLKKALNAGAGAAFSNDVRATPTYLVNGRIVDPGDDGEALADYVAGLLR